MQSDRPIRTRPEDLPAFARKHWAAALQSGEWWDWSWQHRGRLQSVAAILDILDEHLLEEQLKLEPAIRAQMLAAGARFPVSVTPYYLALANPKDLRDPILPQVLPDPAENAEDGTLDPFEEHELMVVPGLVHRYPDRALLLLTNFCTTLCRHCMRKREWLERFQRLSDAQVDAAVEAIAARPRIRDVLISGGDPLNLPPRYLARVLELLRKRCDLDCIRLGSRVPVTLPQRIDDELLTALALHAPLYLNTHVNHERELTAETVEAVARLRSAGVIVSNQAVLLRGVNDSAEDLLNLSRGLLRAGVRAYYLHQCDPVQGASHFRVGLARGRALVAALVGKVSGLAIPHYVVDLPGGAGKVQVSGPALLEENAERALYRSPLSGETVVVDATEGSFAGLSSWIVERAFEGRYAPAPL